MWLNFPGGGNLRVELPQFVAADVSVGIAHEVAFCEHVDWTAPWPSATGELDGFLGSLAGPLLRTCAWTPPVSFPTARERQRLNVQCVQLTSFPFQGP